MVFYLSFSTPIDNDDCNDQGGQRTVTRSNKKIYDRKKMKFAAKALITLALVCSKFKGGDPFTLSPFRRSFPPQREPLSTTCFQQSTRPEGKISLKDIHDALVDPFDGTSSTLSTYTFYAVALDKLKDARGNSLKGIANVFFDAYLLHLC